MGVLVGEPVAQVRAPTPPMPAVTWPQQRGGSPHTARWQPPHTGTHHSSASRFWMGDPLITMRCTVCICLAASVTSASGFLRGTAAGCNRLDVLPLAQQQQQQQWQWRWH